MEYTTDMLRSSATILCCQCGTQIEPNPANMCVPCLRSQVDITEGIPKQSTIYFCKNCERYLQPPNTWIVAALESRELLAICLKKLKGLTKVRLIDAGFVWTEPHSKRIKLKLTIQKEVMNGAVLQQVFVVEYVVNGQMCEDCHRVEAKDYWRAVVQIRQKTGHKKTLFYLEQLILKHGAHANTTSIQVANEGMDFFYAQKQDARKLVDFLHCVVPCKYQTAQELISHDIKNNVHDYKWTFSVEIVPICKDNVVCLPPKLAQQLGNLGQICVCTRVTQGVHLIDPSTLQIAEVPSLKYWQNPFHTLCQPKQLVEFIVVDIDIIADKDRRHVAGHGQESQKHALADVYVMKATDMSGADQQYHTRTHLGHLLQPGDSVLGFHLAQANVNDVYLNKMNPDRVPDVVLVKKFYCDANKRKQKRRWRLKHFKAMEEMETASVERDYNEFLEDLEEDVDYRQNVNIYKDENRVAVDTDDTDDEGIPRISLAEMLDDLHIVEDATGGEGAPMMD